jgi:hypothetical protein
LKGFSFFILKIFTFMARMARKVRKAFLQNASINIARRAMSSAGWRKGEPLEPANEAKGEKPQLNAGSLILQDEVAHISISREDFTSVKAYHINIEQFRCQFE